MKRTNTTATANASKEREYAKVESFIVSNVKEWKENDITFTLTVNGVMIYNCRVVSYKDRDFISFPSRKGSDNKYYNIAYVSLSKEDEEAILGEVERQLNAN